MSYRCDRCKAIQTGSALKRVDEVREVEYNRSFLRFNRRENKKVPFFDATFKGYETVKEEQLCETCYNSLVDTNPIVNKKRKIVPFIGVGKRKSEEEETPEIDLHGLKEKLERRR